MKIEAFNDTQNRPSIRYNVVLPVNTYVAFGYQWGMYGVDMVSFIAGTDNKVRVNDLWAITEDTPAFDS